MYILLSHKNHGGFLAITDSGKCLYGNTCETAKIVNMQELYDLKRSMYEVTGYNGAFNICYMLEDYIGPFA